MTTLSPSSTRRQEGFGWAALVGTLLLGALLGFVGGWWFGGRTSGSEAAATPTPSATTSTSGSPCRSVDPATLPKPSAITVNVYNASNRAGLARSTANDLKARGFVIGVIGNAPTGTTVTGNGAVRYGPKQAKQAVVVAAYVPGAVLTLDPKRTAPNVEVLLGAPFPGVATPQQAAATLAKPRC